MILFLLCAAMGRYRLLEPIRQYALEKLLESGEAALAWSQEAATRDVAGGRAAGLRLVGALWMYGRMHESLSEGLAG